MLLAAGLLTVLLELTMMPKSPEHCNLTTAARLEDMDRDLIVIRVIIHGRHVSERQVGSSI